MQNKPTIAVIGGTGDLDRAWRCCGRSRLSRHRWVAGEGAGASEGRGVGGSDDGAVRGDDNRERGGGRHRRSLRTYRNHDATLEDIKPAMDGKILVDAVVPCPPKVSVVQLPAAGSPPR